MSMHDRDLTASVRPMIPEEKPAQVQSPISSMAPGADPALPAGMWGPRSTGWTMSHGSRPGLPAGL